MRTMQLAKKPRVALMQPHFMPWVGYFELMATADIFIFLDDFQFSRQSWGHRNRILNSQGESIFVTLPLTHPGKLNCNFVDIKPANHFQIWAQKLERSLVQTYNKAPYCNELIIMFTEWYKQGIDIFSELLISFILYLAKYIGINTNIVRSSELIYDRRLKKSEKVINILESVQAKSYLSAAGSFGYMQEDGIFPLKDIEVYFQDHVPIAYPQYRSAGEFIPYLSMFDCLMNVAPGEISNVLYGTKKWLSWDEMIKNVKSDYEIS